MTLRSTLLLAFILLGFFANAQEIRTVDGRRFTVHRVQAGQTLYAISRSYAVPVADIMAANPSAADGLSIDQELLVPMDAVQKRELKTAPTLRNDGELLHTVRKKETLYGIARSYGMDMNMLLERNPEALDLKEGMVLIIPVGKVSGPSAVALAPAQADSMIQHVIGPGETLYSLSRMFNVPVADIEKANGGLKEGLKAGQTVRIPRSSGSVAARPDTVDDHRSKRYKLALLLPFSVAQNDSVLALADNATAHRFYEPTRIAAQFHNGARMALDSLVKLGLKADVVVLDMGEDQKTWNAVVKNPDLVTADLFIGPFHRSAIEQLARANKDAHIVCPVPQSNKMLLGMPNVSKVTPSRTELVKHTGRYVAQKHARDHIILVRPEVPAEKELQDQMATALRSSLPVPSEGGQDSLVEAKPGLRDMAAIINKLNAAKLNVIVVPSENVEFLTSMVVKLKPLVGKYRIALVGLEKWNMYETLAAADLDLLGFRYAAPAYTDHSDPRVQAFTKAYRDNYHTDIDDYALLGFDVTMYYVKALMTQGDGFPARFDMVHTEPLHMGFRMVDTGPENGYRNEFAIMLMQQELRLVKAP